MVSRVLGRCCLVAALSFLGQINSAHAQDLNAQATNLCNVAAGTFITGQYQANQVLDSQALQFAQQQTGGSGVYQQLKPYGQPTGVFVTNPHYDQDQTHGQLFHFYCTTQHNAGMLQWEIKYAASINKLVFYSFAPAQAQNPQQQQFPNNQQQQFPNNQQQQFPNNQQQQFPNNQQQQFPNNQQQQFPNNQQQQFPNNQQQQFPNNQQQQFPNNQQQQFPNNQQQQFPNNQQQQFPNNQQQQVPNNQQQQVPNNQQQTQTPSREEACKMFPGMC